MARHPLFSEVLMSSILQQDINNCSSSHTTLTEEDTGLRDESLQSTPGTNHLDDVAKEGSQYLTPNQPDTGLDWDVNDEFHDLLSVYPIKKPMPEIMPLDKANEQPSEEMGKPDNGNHGAGQVSGRVIKYYEF